MELRFVPAELRRLDELTAEVLACGWFADERPPRGTVGLVDWRLAGAVSRLIQRGQLTGAPGEVVMLPLRPKLPFDKTIVFGLGQKEQFDDDVFRRTVEHMVATMRGLSSLTPVVELPGRSAGVIAPEQAVDILLETTATDSAHDTWTLVEGAEGQARMMTRMAEQRRRVHRIDAMSGPISGR